MKPCLGCLANLSRLGSLEILEFLCCLQLVGFIQNTNKLLSFPRNASYTNRSGIIAV
jgi:hypothetical protein